MAHGYRTLAAAAIGAYRLTHEIGRGLDTLDNADRLDLAFALVGRHAVRVQAEDPGVDPGEAPPILGDWDRIEAAIAVARDARKHLTALGRGRLRAASRCTGSADRRVGALGQRLAALLGAHLVQVPRPDRRSTRNAGSAGAFVRSVGTPSFPNRSPGARPFPSVGPKGLCRCSYAGLSISDLPRKRTKFRTASPAASGQVSQRGPQDRDSQARRRKTRSNCRNGDTSLPKRDGAGAPELGWGSTVQPANGIALFGFFVRCFQKPPP